jgi:lipopolysaccharide transport system ATP-binding protein
MEELGNAGRTVLFVSHALPSIAQLCDRALQIDSGRVVQDGPPAEVIAKYLQQTGSAGPELLFPEELAPGDDLARILGVRVLPHEGMPPGIHDVREPVGIELRFRVLRAGEPVFPKIKVLDRERGVAFNAFDIDSRWHEPTPPGDYAATAWLPANLLNEGPTTVEVAVCSLDFPKLRHHAFIYEAVSFEVLDPGEGDSASGRFGGELRGAVRPLLDWDVERL